VIAKFGGNISPGDEACLEAWLAVAGTRELFETLGALWVQVREEAAGHEPDVQARWKELAARLRLGEERRRGMFPSWRRVAVAAAVVVAVVVGYLAGSGGAGEGVSPLSFSTLSGKSRVSLPDGTVVWLHHNTTLSYGADFGVTRREISFSGEAFFEVARREGMPFRVKSEEVAVQVHGTKFNFRNRAGEDKVTVSLLEGSVEVESGGERTGLEPGYEAVYFKHAGKVERGKTGEDARAATAVAGETAGTVVTARADVALAARWTGESMSFERKSLEEITRGLARWYDVEIRLEGETDAFAYTFTVRDEPLEEIMRLVARIHAVEYHFDERNVLHVKVKP
jgi:ferric-dicitrate binding protein FerR (iron transport regulator)